METTLDNVIAASEDPTPFGILRAITNTSINIDNAEYPIGDVPEGLLSAADVAVVQSVITALEAASLDPAPIQVPQTVTMRQARLALLSAGLLDTGNAAILAAGGAAQIEWEYASEVVRTSALVSGMAAALGMTEQQLDDLFILAATL